MLLKEISVLVTYTYQETIQEQAAICESQTTQRKVLMENCTSIGCSSTAMPNVFLDEQLNHIYDFQKMFSVDELEAVFLFYCL
ncbi:uncharacterized protein Gasu_00570 [Galdieria sulphuraria]|uniref:Uncharacterized protein n=1 Tax=Galdieria sulphuraria TaxID=130081 RepID=M2XR08_GALSU|nr:uncharacterized protein Gasu_00570 [Galdieria sulphuraria]EME32687.1 hypothetical protein Gasu_00570 [Galdieria sulphuraria]|eukprot:XP_005709207.1 hypothetical protein Gasu_00570 [Galdieria sulphuraria]